MNQRAKIRVDSGGMENYRIKEIDNKQGGIAYVVQMKAYAPLG
ncbi:hypothetical protein [Litorimonas haliclonae]